MGFGLAGYGPDVTAGLRCHWSVRTRRGYGPRFSVRLTACNRWTHWPLPDRDWMFQVLSQQADRASACLGRREHDLRLVYCDKDFSLVDARADGGFVASFLTGCDRNPQGSPAAGLRPADSVRNMTLQPSLDRPSQPPCAAYVSRQSRRRASADDSVTNTPSQPPLDHPSEPPCAACVSRQVRGEGGIRPPPPMCAEGGPPPLPGCSELIGCTAVRPDREHFQESLEGHRGGGRAHGVH